MTTGRINQVTFFVASFSTALLIRTQKKGHTPKKRKRKESKKSPTKREILQRGQTGSEGPWSTQAVDLLSFFSFCSMVNFQPFPPFLFLFLFVFAGKRNPKQCRSRGHYKALFQKKFLVS